MTDDGYGLWGLVIVDTVVFGLFAFSFFHPASKRDWRAMGAFWAFLAALFTGRRTRWSHGRSCRTAARARAVR